ncbi:MAG: peptide chain release factor N(5)-glutamine methyltransferase [Flavobacteriaceae bacterium]|nr:peptide chain release factor N(5)-glutamine methyltransferase [Flavobacteriaceae bacterium]
MDVKRFIMTVLDFKNIFVENLESQIDQNELNELFFWLIEHYCKIDKISYILNQNYKLKIQEKEDLQNAIELLKKETPIQYIIGSTEFKGINFCVNSNVLIPRPETEELVNWILEDNPKNKKILDIGTGSGCIAISLSKSLEDCFFEAWDVCKEAISVAKRNSKKHKTKITFKLKDIRNDIFYDNKFDIIVSNPPYVTHIDKQNMSKKVLNFEPHIALFVPQNEPLFYYKKILKFSERHLKSKGIIYLEINENLSKDVKELLYNNEFHDIKLRKDFRQKNRMIKAVKK